MCVVRRARRCEREREILQKSVSRGEIDGGVSMLYVWDVGNGRRVRFIRTGGLNMQ